MTRIAIMTMATILATATAAGAAVYDVTIENQIPGGADTGQPFSPPVLVVHNSSYALFTPGGTASAGLEIVAEEGNPSMLQSEAFGNTGVQTVVVGTGPFFDAQTIKVDADPGDLLSMVWMLGRTNDLFAGIGNIPLPETGTVEYFTTVWDAGTEVNSGLAAHIPFYGNLFAGTQETGTIMSIAQYTVNDDPTHGVLTWNFPPSARVTITVTNGTPVQAATWGAVKNLYR